jgi:hypothetical protein
MDHYEGRKHPGWHHPTLICLPAHFLLWHVNIRLGGKRPGLDPPPDVDVIGGGLTVTEAGD